MKALIIIFAILVIFAIILLLNIDAKIQVGIGKRNTDVRIFIGGVRVFKLSEPKPKKETSNDTEDTLSGQADTMGALDTFKMYKAVFKAIKKRTFQLLDYIFARAIAIKELSITGDIGFDSAATTGIVCGMINAVYYNLTEAIRCKIKLDKDTLDINANFDNEALSVNIYTYLRTNTFCVLTIAIKGLKIFRIYVKEKQIYKENAK